jgi:hypothetical protein
MELADQIHRTAVFTVLTAAQSVAHLPEVGPLRTIHALHGFAIPAGFGVVAFK